MEDTFENRETGIGTVEEVPVPEDEHRLTLSEVDQIDDGNGDWGFTIFADKDVFLASVSYPTQADALQGRIAMAKALENAIFIATSES